MSLASPALAGKFFTTSSPWEGWEVYLLDKLKEPLFRWFSRKITRLVKGRMGTKIQHTLTPSLGHFIYLSGALSSRKLQPSSSKEGEH